MPQNKYLDLYEYAPAAYLILDGNSIIVESNMTCADLFETEKTSLIGQNFSRFISDDYQNVFRFYQKRLAETGTRRTCRLELKKKDGSPFYTQLDSIMVKGADGDFAQIRIQYRILITNIEELRHVRQISDEAAFREMLTESYAALTQQMEKQSEEISTLRAELQQQTEPRVHGSSLHREMIFEGSSDGFLILDWVGNILEINPAAAMILGCSQGEIMGMNIRDTAFSHTSDNIFKALERTIRTGSDCFETAFPRRDGNMTDIAVSMNLSDTETGRIFFFSKMLRYGI